MALLFPLLTQLTDGCGVFLSLKIQSECQMIPLFLFCLQAEEPQEEEEQAQEQMSIKEENPSALYIYFYKIKLFFVMSDCESK